MKQYILDHQTPVLELDIFKWAHWMETHDLTVARTENGVVFVSTVFLGTDVGYFEDKPVLFETMVFLLDSFKKAVGREEVDFSCDMMMRRWSSWDEAQDGHHEVVTEVLQQLDNVTGDIAKVISRVRIDGPRS